MEGRDAAVKISFKEMQLQRQGSQRHKRYVRAAGLRAQVDKQTGRQEAQLAQEDPSATQIARNNIGTRGAGCPLD